MVKSKSGIKIMLGLLLGVIFLIVILDVVSMATTGFRWVKPWEYQSTKKVVEIESRVNGKCELISVKRKLNYREVVLRDELQGFEYIVSQEPQSYHTIFFGNCSGEYMWRHSTFDAALLEHVGELAKDSLEELCTKYHISYSISGECRTLSLYYIDTTDEEMLKIVMECASILDGYNIEGRLDQMHIMVLDAEYGENGNLQKTINRGTYHIGEGVFYPPREY